MEYNTKGTVLKKAVVWKELYFYRKSDAIYQLTWSFATVISLLMEIAP